ncbi:hypothetical protein UIS43_19270 [Nocardiopsis sp. LDBS0036]|uniref:hypothetical protein n=1 Tax=Nocardiopsis sp. LDBS0036 TaxID=3104276 RepID=UPI003516FB73
MSPAPHTTKTATALVLALLLTACGGAEPEQAADAPDAAAADAQDSPTEGTPEEAVELVDPMELAPDDLCAVPSDETLDELLGGEDMRSDAQQTTGRPDPADLEDLDRLRMSCLLVTAGGLTLQYDMEVHEGPYADSTLASVTEEEADPGIDLGDFAVTGSGSGDDGADVTVVEGQVMVHVSYKQVGGGAQEELLDGALTVAEELLASVG